MQFQLVKYKANWRQHDQLGIKSVDIIKTEPTILTQTCSFSRKLFWVCFIHGETIIFLQAQNVFTKAKTLLILFATNIQSLVIFSLIKQCCNASHNLDSRLLTIDVKSHTEVYTATHWKLIQIMVQCSVM